MSVDFAKLVIQADSSELKLLRDRLKDVDGQAPKTEQSTSQLGKSIKKYLTFAAVAGGAALLTREILRTTAAMDETIKRARSLSVGVEAFQELSYAAELSGVSSEGLSTSLRYLNQNIYNNHKAFGALGLSVEGANGKLKSAEDMLPEIANKFADMEEGAEKTALAQEMFGRSGTMMINMLKDGSAGLEEMAQEARNLGIIFDEETAKKAEMFNDNMTRMGKLQEGLFTQLTANLLPAFVNLTDEMTASSDGASIMEDVTKGLTHIIKGVIAGVVGLYFALKTAADFITTAVVGSLMAWYEGFTNIGDIMKTIGRAFVKLVKGDLSGAVEELTTGMKENFTMTFDVVKTGIDDISKNMEDAKRVLGGLFDEVDMDEQEKKLSLYRDTAGDATEKINGLSEAEKRLAEAMRDAEAIRQKTLTSIQQHDEAIDHLNKTKANSSMTDETYEIALAQIENTLKESQQRQIDALYSGLLTQEEEIEQSYIRRRELIINSTATTEEQRQDLLLRLSEETNKKQKSLMDQQLHYQREILSQQVGYITTTSDAILDITRNTAGEQSSIYQTLFAINQAIALKAAIIDTFSAVSKANASAPYPYNIPAIIAAGVTGGVQVAGIAATTIGSFAGEFADGGKIPAGQWGIVGETGKPEIVHGPASVTGVNETENILNRNPEAHYHYHVGTLIANEHGMKDFVRRTEKYRIAEKQRTGS